MSSNKSAQDWLIWSFHSAMVAASEWPVPISWSHTAFVAATRSVPVFVVSRANSRNFSMSNCGQMHIKVSNFTSSHLAKTTYSKTISQTKWDVKKYLYLGEILSDVFGSGHNFFLGDPVFQIIDFALQLIKFECLVQLSSAFLRQVFESFIQFIYLGLAYLNLLAIKNNTRKVLN